VFASLAAAGVVSPFYMGGLSSFAVGTTPDARRAFGFDALSYNFSAVAGPAAVAVLSIFLPPQAIMCLLALSAALGAAGICCIRLRTHPPADISPWRAVLAGLHHTFGHRKLSVVTVASTVSQIGQGGLAIAAVSLSIARVGSPGDGAIVVTAFAVGSLVGAVLETVRPAQAQPNAIMMGGFLGTGAFTVGAAFDFGMAWTVVAIGISGVFTASSTAAMLLLRNRLSPPHLNSQVFTVGAGLRTSASASGAALTASATGLGAASTIVLIGLIWVVSAAMMAAYPKSCEG
jgi:hypothetical protein